MADHQTQLENFPAYASRQTLTRFLSRYELFKQVLHVHGSIVECGVLDGGGLMAWAQLSAIFEPVNWSRKIIGFDTFAGFKGVCSGDITPTPNPLLRDGAMSSDSYDALLDAIRTYDENRFLSHIDKVELVRGDIRETAPAYIMQNPHLLVSLLHLDLDLYGPTLAALNAFLPRMPKGAIIVFDEINAPQWAGETRALLETFPTLPALRRFDFDSLISYTVIE